MNDIFTMNSSLQPKVWQDKELKTNISYQLLEIAKEFFTGLKTNVPLEDVTFTGSLANYNWTKYSDIDLHLIVDFSKIDANTELVREFFNAKTSLWNKTHNIFIKGYEVEIYVQDINEDHHSTGVYSIKNNNWIAEPVRIQPKINTDMVKRKINSFIDMIDRVEDVYDDKNYEKAHREASKLARKIKKFRQAGLEDEGEYSNENLAFKYLRNNEHIKTLYDTKNKSYDKMMSLENDFEKKFKIFVSQDKINDSDGFNRLQEEEKFQKRVKKRHFRMKRRLISLGKQRNVPPYSRKPRYKRGKSAPPGFGGT